MASRPNPNQYYRPYAASDSDEDSEIVSVTPSGSIVSDRGLDSGTITPIRGEEPPNFAQFAYQLAQALSAGPTFSSIQQQLLYGKNELSRNINYGPYTSEIPQDDEKRQTNVRERVSLVTLQSRDRDRSVYPQPTFCVLNLPRTYANVKLFQISQISLLSAFYYFRADKANLLLQAEEQGRLVYDQTNTAQTDPANPSSYLRNIINTTIREGSYSIDSLITELTIRLNTPPLFYDYANGIKDFNTVFQIAGDFSLNFNYPGDYFYDSIKNIYISNPTMNQITQSFFQTSYAPAAAAYTVSQVQIAFYYPVLREAIVDTSSGISLDLSIPPPFTLDSTQSVTDRILYNFQGINDSFVLAMILQNQSALDEYRLKHTFRYGLINKYVVSYETNNNRIIINAVSLNQSLVNLLTSKYNLFLSQQLLQKGITSQQYATINSALTQRQSIFQDMYRFLQEQMALYFGISVGTYTKDYFTYIDTNYFLIQNGLNLKQGEGGVLLQNPVTDNSISTNILLDQSAAQPNYWPGLTGLPLPIQTVSTNMGPGGFGLLFPTTSNFPYNIARANIDISRNVIGITSTINADYRRRCVDIITDIEPMKYTIFEFQSKFRQTLQVEVFPRPTQYRNPEFLSTLKSEPTFSSSITYQYPVADLFDYTYSYKVPTDPTVFNKLLNDTIIRPIPGFSTTTNPTSLHFGSSFETLFSLWTTPINLNLTSCNAFYSFQTPVPTNLTPFEISTNTYYYPLTLSFSTSAISQNSNSDVSAFLYHDIAAFLADVTCNRNENPLHYIQSFSIPISNSYQSYTFKAYANQTYYLNIRTTELTPNQVSAYVVPWFPSTTFYATLSTSLSNYNPYANPLDDLTSIYNARLADSNYIRLPIASTLFQEDPSKDPLNKIPETDLPSIGYDLSNVSNDLTDYMPFSPFNSQSNLLPSAAVRCDPTNNYFFRYSSPYNTDPTIQSYFYSGSSNGILSPGLVTAYTKWSQPPLRQYKIVHWYGTHYISEAHSPGYLDSVPQSPYISPYTSTTTNGPLNLYTYQNANQELSLDVGVCGFSFLPSDGVWAVQRITFKSNFTGSVDCNDTIRSLGIFLTSEITNIPVQTLSLDTAIFKLDFQSKITYSSITSLNEGYDASLGTYYTFSTNASFQTKSSTILTGYTQNGKVLIDDVSAFYSVIPFDSNNKVTEIINLVGSPVPYPYVYSAQATSTFYGTPAPTNYGVVIPVAKQVPSTTMSLYGPPPGYDETLSVYEQSIPLNNSIIHYKSAKNFIEDPQAFRAWSTIPVQQPTSFCANVKGFALFGGNSITLATYPYNDINSVLPTSNDRYFTFKGSLTPDLIFPGSIQTSFINFTGTAFLGFSGNDSNFHFFALDADVSQPTTQLRIKTLDPSPAGSISQLPIFSNYQVPMNITVFQCIANSYNGFFLSGLLPNQSTIVIGTPNYLSTSCYSSNIYPGHNYINISMDPNGSYLYVMSYNSNITSGVSSLQRYTLSNFTGGSFPTVTRIDFQTATSLPFTYSQMFVTKNNKIEEVYMVSRYDPTYPRYYFYIKTLFETSSSNVYTGQIVKSVFLFQDPQTNLRPPLLLCPGYGGAKWALYSNEPYIEGNRNDLIDSPVSIQNAWQIFIPVQKIQMTRKANTYTPVTDLNGIAYPEYGHSMVFAYTSLSSLNSDLYISTPAGTTAKWGKESNYLVADTKMSGYYFGGYIRTFPLESYSSTLKNTYYVALRGYSPTESFQTMVRFYLPNRYDFGFVTANDLITEIPILLGSNFWDPNAPPDPTIRPDLFNPTFGQVLKIFNSKFLFSNPRLFGSNDLLNFAGYPISSYGYGDFMVQYSNFYTSYQEIQQTVTDIQTAVTSNLNSFIATNLQYILPSSALTRQRYTDPIPFRILWSSCLDKQRSVLDDEWGLGWNLGFPKQDTLFATTQVAPSFYKILDEYIYLRLNDNFNLNRLDKGSKENYKITREPTGTTQSYNSKLLLTNFGNYANVLVQNPVYFDPIPLQRIDKLSFTWADPTGTTLQNNDCEWTVVVQITEKIA